MEQRQEGECLDSTERFEIEHKVEFNFFGGGINYSAFAVDCYTWNRERRYGSMVLISIKNLCIEYRHQNIPNIHTISKAFFMSISTVLPVFLRIQMCISEGIDCFVPQQHNFLILALPKLD